MLLKTQRNEFFNTAQVVGLNVQDFVVSHDTTEFFISPSPQSIYFFQVKPSGYLEIPFAVQAQPGPTKGPIYTGNVDWNKLRSYFSAWCHIMREEQDTPDLWADLQTNARLFGATQSAPEEVFSPDDLRQVRIQLQHIQQRLLTLGLPEAAAQQLAQTVQEAGAKAERFTKKEWQGWFIGAMISQMTNLALTPEHVQSVYLLLKTTFTGLFLH